MGDLIGFNVGLCKRISSYYYSQKTYLCGCGHSFQSSNSSTCPVCGNKEFKEVNRIPKTKTLIDSKFDVLEKNDVSFYVKKTEVIAKIENGEKIIGYVEGKQTYLKVSLKDKTMQLFDSEENPLELTTENLEIFSKNVRKPYAFIQLISTEKNISLFETFLGVVGKHGHEKFNRLHRVFVHFFNNPHIEILYNCGFSAKEVNYYYNNYCIRKNETTPHKILRIPKYLLRFLVKMDTLDWYKINNLIQLDKALNGNNLKTILTILDEESDLRKINYMNDRLIEMFNNYGYKDVKRLMLYVAREVKLQQGIDNPTDALTILRDYARTCKEMGINYEKYPKSLKKDHDIASLNYRINKDEIKRKKFIETISNEEYSKLMFKDKEYSIIIPNEPQDVVKEGELLSHCVASYINDIINNKCKILFMRPTKELEKSLLTIEIRDNKYIRQVKGKQNRKPREEEIKFISKWAEKLQLEVSGY